MSTQVAEVGRFYMVPCMHAEPDARVFWMPRDGWVPVLGPRHEDTAHLNFPHQHYHIDWRFMPANALADASMLSGYPHGRVLTNTGGGVLAGTPQLRRRKCRRRMPEHPQVTHALFRATLSRGPDNWRSLERDHACTKLKPGNVCPHRGIDLTPFIKPDGTVICPGHGLRWDTKTGDLLPHHAVGVSA